MHTCSAYLLRYLIGTKWLISARLPEIVVPHPQTPPSKGSDDIFMVVLSQQSRFRMVKSDCRYSCLYPSNIGCSTTHMYSMDHKIPSERWSCNGAYNQESIQMSPDPPPCMGVSVWERHYHIVVYINSTWGRVCNNIHEVLYYIVSKLHHAVVAS